MTRSHRFGLTSLLAVALLLLYTSVGRAQNTDVEVHDPVMIRQGDTYYLFHTGRGISVWSSRDLEDWQREAPVFESAPAWTDQVVPGFRNHIWAPDIAYHNGRYYLYYSVSAFGKNTSAIGVATNTTLDPGDPAFEWVDHGPVVRSIPGRDLWNAIDPNLAFDDAGTPWLAFGSFWSGIKLVKLEDNLLEIARPNREWYTVAARRRAWETEDADPGNAAIEAPFIFEKDGFYYLFVSWDYCCRGEESTYKMMVGRSREITGPYRDREGQDMRFGGGTLVAEGNSEWSGVGHCAAYTFDGTDYLIFHGYDLSDEGESKLWIEEIRWDDQGWPVISLTD